MTSRDSELGVQQVNAMNVCLVPSDTIDPPPPERDSRSGGQSLRFRVQDMGVSQAMTPTAPRSLGFGAQGVGSIVKGSGFRVPRSLGIPTAIAPKTLTPDLLSIEPTP